MGHVYLSIYLSIYLWNTLHIMDSTHGLHMDWYLSTDPLLNAQQLNAKPLNAQPRWTQTTLDPNHVRPKYIYTWLDPNQWTPKLLNTQTTEHPNYWTPKPLNTQTTKHPKAQFYRSLTQIFFSHICFHFFISDPLVNAQLHIDIDSNSYHMHSQFCRITNIFGIFLSFSMIFDWIQIGIKLHIWKLWNQMRIGDY